MTKKEQCKQIMESLFGTATSAWVDSLSEEIVVDKCKEKVTAMLGESLAADKFKGI